MTDEEIYKEAWQIANKISGCNAQTKAIVTLVHRVRAEQREAIEKLRRPPSPQFNVRFVDHIQGTNSAEWECDNCKGRWSSPSLLECPHCHDNAAPSKITEADANYNRAIDDVLAAIRRAGERQK